MRDFTLLAYQNYLQAIQAAYSSILRFDEYFLVNSKPERFCLIRHDVDRWPRHALRMARMETEAGIYATYYFRAKRDTFRPALIEQIAGLGHEIGYHYECLSATNGDIERALSVFQHTLEQFRQVVPVRTISMHGDPFRPFDNSDMWRDENRKREIFRNCRVLGEVYLDIDYTDIAYITDTGRNWSSSKANRRDKVDSTIHLDFQNGTQLLSYLGSSPQPKMIFQIHPERWSDRFAEWCFRQVFDSAANLAKPLARSVKDGEKRK